ncbi:MAG: DNA repair protein RecO [Ignavibacteria bacterium GWF2_33_9]|nr:MAG: DNA repair protein RecO [Ignavibacteria bacterium GWF2_33_9]
MIEKTEAIVLNSKKYGETSKIVNFFTKDFGRMTAIVKGAQKQKNKFGSTLEPMNYLTIFFYKKPESQLQLLSDTEIAVNFWNIRTSLEHTAIAFAMAETIYKILEEHYVNLHIFKSMIKYLQLLNDSPKEPFCLLLKFLLDFMSNLGLNISISNEILFQTPNRNLVTFNYENGTFHNYNTKSEENRYNVILDLNLYKKINDIYNSEINEIPEVAFDKGEVYKLLHLFNKYLGYHTDKSLFLESINLIY